MRIGYLHLGPERGGVRRYGTHIAAEARRRAGHAVVEADGGAPRPTVAGVARAARRLGSCDVVQLQWKPNDWGRGWRALGLLALFTALCRRPLVVTVHDVYEPGSGRDARLGAEALALRLLGRHARALVVHGREEMRRLALSGADRRARVVAHFVEERRLPETRDEAKMHLGLSGRRVVTLLGYITGRKGHLLLVDALPHLPEDVIAVAAGSPIEGRRVRVDELEARVRQLGLVGRVVMTGFLEEPQLERVLAATDVAACPFRDVSASGSLSTWISVARPIVASDLPALREYDELEPGAIRFFAPYEARALAEALRAALDPGTSPGSGAPSGGDPDVGHAAAGGEAAEDPAVARLRSRLLTPQAFDAYEAILREAAAR